MNYKLGIHTGYGYLAYSSRYFEYAHVVYNYNQELRVTDGHLALQVI